MATLSWTRALLVVTGLFRWGQGGAAQSRACRERGAGGEISIEQGRARKRCPNLNGTR